MPQSDTVFVDGKKYRRHMNPGGSRGGWVPQGVFISGLGRVFIDPQVMVCGQGLHIEGHIQILPMRKNEPGEMRSSKPDRITIRGVEYRRNQGGGLVAYGIYLIENAFVDEGLMVAGHGDVLGRYFHVRRFDPAVVS